MKVFIAPSEKETGKFKGVVHAFPDIWKGSVLDVGCRSGNLKNVLNEKNVHYTGFDINPPADIIGNIEDGLPFRNNTFDIVVASDVLEHTNDIYRSFSELCRVASKYIIITLPNLYELKIRLRFLFGKTISQKYGLPEIPPNDRHRWFLSFDNARKFCRYQAEQNQAYIIDEGCLVGPKRRIIINKLLLLFPNLFSPHYLVLMGKKTIKS